MDRFFKKIIITPVLVILVILMGFIYAYIFNDGFAFLNEDPFSSSKVNILISGSDISYDGPTRADTIIVTSVDLDTKDIGVLFIPRDTRLNIPGHGINKVNSSFALGGIDLLKETLESFLEIPIDYYVSIDFEGFSKIIDNLGGIEIDVETHLHYIDEAGDLYIDIPEGRQTLSGSQALDYVRYREPLYADIGRIGRQQKFIESLIKRILQPDLLIRIPAIYNNFQNHVDTSLSLREISYFTSILKGLDLNQVKLEKVPGQPEYIDNVSYWLPDREGLNIVVDSLVRSKEYIQNNDYQLSVYNGAGVRGLAGEVAGDLRKYGFEIATISNADHYDYQTSIIEYFASEDQPIAEGIQKIIGGSLKYSENNGGKINIIVGQDYVE